MEVFCINEIGFFRLCEIVLSVGDVFWGSGVSLS